MKEVNFLRGLKSKYLASAYPDSIYFATDTKEIIVNGVSYGSVDIDDELTEVGKNPVMGSAIYKAIKENISEAINTAPYGAKLQVISAGTNVYQILLLDKNDNELSRTSVIVGEQSEASDISGLVFSRIGDQNIQAKGGQTAVLKYEFDVWDSTGSSLGKTGLLSVVMEDESNEPFIKDQVISAGQGAIDVTEYLEEGKLVQFWVTATAETDKGTQTKTLYYTVRLVNLSLSSDYDISTVTTVGDNIHIPYTVQGISDVKTIKAYLDGVEVASNTSSSAADVQSFDISTTGLSHGTHNIQILAQYDVKDSNGIITDTVYSDLIYFDVPVIEVGNDTPVFGFRVDVDNVSGPLINTVPSVKVNQYDIFGINYYVYNPNLSRNVDFYSDGVLIGNYELTDTFVQLIYKYNISGIKNCNLVCNGQTYNFYINVEKSQYTVTEPTSGLKLYLDSLGKSNTSANRAEWKYGDITSDFEGFKWGGDGWLNVDGSSVLRLIGGDKVTINYKPLEQTVTSKNAFAASIKFRVNNITDENEELISCLDSNGVGFVIRANEAALYTNEKNSVSTKFAAGETYNIGFVSFPEATTNDSYSQINSNRLYLYVNGTICGTVQRKSTDSIYQDNPQPIVIKSDSCTLDIFSIRCYDQQLTDEQKFDAYLIDLSDSNLLAQEYTQNDVLNLSGDVSVEKVHGKIPYMIITGNVQGLNAVQYVAAVNDKDYKHNIDQILYVDTNPEFNFKSEPNGSDYPILRLQGTSSMMYARKNYRIYTKKTKLYLGCDKDGEGGILQSEPIYAMSNTAAPVNCWCLKADYAESSSSHNTGFANLVQDVLTSIGDLTPAQSFKNDNYPYEVRTTIEGHPCLLFARETLTSTPKFVGKFNFNNDKSTEDVFGFLDINGYHKESEFTNTLDVLATASLEFPEGFESVSVTDDGETTVYTKQDIINLLEKNPTECWEFRNNESQFGIFKTADFDALNVDGEYAWLDCWEARFPDEDGLNAAFKAGVKPVYLRRLAQWIHSTDTTAATNNVLGQSVMYNGINYTTDSVEYRKAKFLNEVSDYFDVTFLCDYYALNDAVAGADQRVKNMMWAFWYNPNYQGKGDGVLCYPIYYDNDTILGVNNAGTIAINWDADEETKYSNGSYVFAGHDSVIWKNVRELLAAELADSYKRIRANMSNSVMKDYFNTQQSEVYGEKVFNKDTLYKYVTPTAIGTEYIDSSTNTIAYTKWADQASFVHGSRKAHRDWFIANRMGMFDAKYATGTYVDLTSELSWKGETNKIPSLTAVADGKYYFGISSDLVSLNNTHSKVEAGATWVYNHTEIPATGSVFHLYGIKEMKELDLGNWGGFNTFTINSCPVLEKFVFGSMSANPNVLTDLAIGTKMPLLKYIDVSNTVGGGEAGDSATFNNLDLTGCLYIETVIAQGCSNLATISFAEGSLVNYMLLPTGYKNLYLRSLPQLTIDGINYESDASSIERLIIENCEKINSMELLNKIMNVTNSKLTRIRITGLNLKGNGQDLIEIMNKGLKGIDSTGTAVDKCTLTGTYQLTTLLDNALYKQLCDYFELNILQPEYTIISFDCAQTTSEKVTNYDNETGYEFGNTYSPSGHITKILDQRHSYLVKYPISYPSGEFAAVQLDDNDSTKFVNGETALLDGTYGDFCMYEPHYWYKGVNDHKKQMLYLLFSSNKECPRQAVGKKISIGECELKAGYGVSTSNQYSTYSQALVAQSDYNLYSYILPENHNYKQYRVASVTSAVYGCIVVDKNDNIIQRLSQSGTAGMYDTSYLFDTISENAYKIYMTINKNVTPEYCLYLTESSDIEAIEPDWVEHKECFVGRVFSTLYQGEVKSAIYSGISPENWQTTGFYPQVSGISVRTINNTITSNGKGYYAVDYEVFKDIINLAYAKYGSTGLHSNHVGAGADAQGKFDTYYIGRYFPNTSVEGTKYGINDTITDSAFESYYSPEADIKEYPGTSTLMGYYHFVGQGVMTSYLDKITMSNKTYSNERTGRSLKLYTETEVKYNKNIIGGRYFDIFGTSSVYGATSSNDGFCGREFTTVSGVTTSPLLIGYRASSSGVQSYNLQASNVERTSMTTSISYNDINNAQRILIVPDKITYFDTISEYNKL